MSIVDMDWKGVGIVYGRHGGGKTTFALETAKDFALRGHPVFYFCQDEKEARILRGKLFSVWPELGNATSGHIYVRPCGGDWWKWHEIDKLARAERVEPRLVIVDLNGAWSHKEYPTWNEDNGYTVLLTLNERPSLQSINHIRIPLKLQYGASAVFQTEGGQVLLKKHRFLATAYHSGHNYTLHKW